MDEIKSFGEKVFSEKLEKAKYQEGIAYDFAGKSELTVTITLAEYRSLVMNLSVINIERSKRWETESKCRALEEKVKTLESMLEGRKAEEC